MKTIDEYKAAEKDGKVSDFVRREWKEPIVSLLERERKFLTGPEIRRELGADDMIFSHLYYLRKRGILIRTSIDGEPHYGLPGFLIEK